MQISKFGPKNQLNRFRFRVKFNLIDLRILLKWQTADFPNNSSQIMEWFSFTHKYLRPDTAKIADLSSRIFAEQELQGETN